MRRAGRYVQLRLGVQKPPHGVELPARVDVEGVHLLGQVDCDEEDVRGGESEEEVFCLGKS